MMVVVPNQTASRARGSPLHRFTRALANQLPKGLYTRALIIIIAPIVLLQSVVAFVFMERHWELVTHRLSTATTRDIAMLIQIYESYGQKGNFDYERIIEMARNELNLSVEILPLQDLPQVRPKPFFDILDYTLSEEIAKYIGKPFWIDTVGRSSLVEIRIKLDDAVFRVLARRSQTYASNSHIFLVWMVGTSLVLLTVAILFLRNQIKPILRLAEAAELFGKGRPPPPDFRSRGAREVRQAATAFMEMRNRIERQIDQRTTMLAGVSHDLRTILTRFKLQLAMLGDNPEADAMRGDVAEMGAMLEDYLAFAKGDSSEEISDVDMRAMLQDIHSRQAVKPDKAIAMKLNGASMMVPLRRNAFKRAVDNIVNNATRYADSVAITASKSDRWLTIEIEDDGPGIPSSEREEVFRPFYRLDATRNLDAGGTGLGLTIARDVVRGHGGDITLATSKLGGLKATIRVPV